MSQITFHGHFLAKIPLKISFKIKTNFCSKDFIFGIFEKDSSFFFQIKFFEFSKIWLQFDDNFCD